MNKFLIILIFSIFGQSSENIHTCENETVKCPIDGNKVTFCLTMSMTTIGSYRDFEKKGFVGIHYEELINTCSKCKFSGYYDDFKVKLKQDEKINIKNHLLKYNDKKIGESEQCLIAANIKEIQKQTNEDIAFCYLTGSYLLREDEKQAEFRKELQSKAKDFLIASLEKNEYKDKSNIATINYLIAEMYRRIGSFEDAIKYYDLAIRDENKNEWVESVAKEQKELAIKKDDNNKI